MLAASRDGGGETEGSVAGSRGPGSGSSGCGGAGTDSAIGSGAGAGVASGAGLAKRSDTRVADPPAGCGADGAWNARSAQTRNARP